jgi:predicted nucleic acid-binding protein
LSVYLDASALIPILTSEASTERVETFLRSAEGPFLVGDFAAAEVASAISRLLRTGQFTLEAANQALTAFDAWCANGANRVEVEPADARLAAIFVRRFDLLLRAPDALHIAVTQRLGATLLTLDQRLAAAATNLQVAVTLL